MKKVALIHDICGMGKAGMGNLFMILSISQMEVCQIPTMILSTHTGGYGQPATRQFRGYIKECAVHYASIDISFDYIFVGYLGDKELVSEVSYFIETFREATVFFDPIMADNGSYYRNFGTPYKNSLKQLINLCDILCPNYTEACLLADSAVDRSPSKEAVLDICNKLNDGRDKDIIITSIPTNRNLGIAVYQSGELTLLEYPMAGRSYPGTGDTFGAVILSYLAKDMSLLESVKMAHSFVVECIQYSEKLKSPVREGIGLEVNLIHLLPKLNKI